MLVQARRQLRSYLDRRLQRRLIAVSAFFLFLASLAFLVILLVLHTQMLLAENKRASLALNTSLQIALENAMLKRDLPGLTQIVGNLGRQEGIDAIMIVNPTGEIRFSDRHERIGQRLDDPGIAEALEAQTGIGSYRNGQGGARVLRSINPVLNRPACAECHGAAAAHPVNGLLIVDFQATPVLVHALRGTAMLIAMGAVVMAFLGFALWKATRRLVLDRLDPLSGALRAVGKGDVATRVAVDGTDEIAAFARGFNTMASRLEVADAALRTARDAFEAILAAAPDGIRVIDAEYRVIHANDAHLAQLGLPASKVVGQACHVLTHGLDEPCPSTLQPCPVRRVLGEGEAKMRFTDRHCAANGKHMNVEVTAAPIRLPVDGAIVDGVIEVIRDLDRDMDISHQQRLSEIALLANGVAHEINTPLSSIYLALGAIREELPEQGEGRELADLMEAEIQSCMGVTESLMRLSQPSVATVGAVDLVEVSRSLLRLVRQNLEQGGIVAQVVAPDELFVEAFDSDVRILVLNLVVNAIHAMPEGGTLQIEIERNQGGVRLSVADTGVGIAAENLKDIFLPFWTRRPDGTAGRGLGLAICRQVVERMGGRIEVASEVGTGSRFTVYLGNQASIQAPNPAPDQTSG